MVAGRLTPNGLVLVPVELGGRPFEAVVDTGFEGALQLPDWLFPHLNPPVRSQVQYQLPTGQIAFGNTYDVTVTLGGDDFVCEALFSPNDEVLIGVELLRDYRLEVNFPAGAVVVERVRP